MMKYPYTFTAKVAQFPVQHYIKNVWVLRYYAFGVGLSAPLFYWIQKKCKLYLCTLSYLCHCRSPKIIPNIFSAQLCLYFLFSICRYTIYFLSQVV